MDGQILEVQATDKGSMADLEAWAGSVGHQYVGTVEENEVLFTIFAKVANEEIEEETFE